MWLSTSIRRCEYIVRYKKCKDLLSTYFNLSKSLQTGDYVAIVKVFQYLILWMIFFFYFCDFGERVTSNHYICLRDSIYQKSWHICSLDLQKSFKLMIMLYQRPVYVQGFAGVQCTRENFQKVFFSFTQSEKNLYIHSKLNILFNRLSTHLLHISWSFVVSIEETKLAPMLIFAWIQCSE